MFRGVFTAIITPFKSSGMGLDESTFEQLLERQERAGVSGVIVGGSTGEGQTLTSDELSTAVKVALKFKKSMKILGACGSSATYATVEKFKLLHDLGVDGVLISTPAYNKPPQRGLIEHYEIIAKTAPLPIMVYNIPGRSGVNLMPATMKTLWRMPNIVALKESSGSVDQISQVLKEAPKEKTVLSGDDSLNMALFALGAHGTVSVVSNLLPQPLVNMWRACQNGQWEQARAIHNRLLEIIPLLFLESNPIPIKWAVGHMLQKNLKPRLPLVPLEEAHQKTLKPAVDAFLKVETH